MGLEKLQQIVDKGHKDTGVADLTGSESPTKSKDKLADIGRQVKIIRRAKKLTLEELAVKSGVSRAMISKIERGESSPSAIVLGKLAEGFQIGISALVGGTETQSSARLYRPQEQPVFRDAETGFERRSLSPIFPMRGGVDVVGNVIQPGGTSGTFPAHDSGVTEVLVVLRGKLKVTLGEDEYIMEQGDSLFFHADVSHRFDNIAEIATEFMITIDGTALR